ncbi:Hypothetical predicted protein [Paramuricea clavata]|uniref:Uncharacterized protein n=1 Tax=Paramuricea clavata TaxID=317549 RepID=A0A6S7HHG1_PARCT|nr:Hypothetical predicted protein [Paramuricea clavata]
MKCFGLKSPDDLPTKNLPPPETANAKVKMEWMYECATAILHNYVMADIAKTHPRFEGNAKETTEPSTSTGESTNTDYVYNYACSLLFLDMLVKYYEDAIKEGLPHQLSMKHKWGRFVNQKGVANSMECDRSLESEVMPQVISHSKVSRDLDLQVMVSDLLRQDVFEFVSGRKHPAFSFHNRLPVHNFQPTALLKWMKTLKGKFARGNLLFLMDGSVEDGSVEDGNEEDGQEK